MTIRKFTPSILFAFILLGCQQENTKDVSLGSPAELLKKDKLNTTKPFIIEPTNKSNEQCFSELSEAFLNLEVDILNGITKKQLTTNQVQHSFDCSWMLMHDEDHDGFDEDHDGFGKATIRELIELDPSLCHAFEMPCGYYAERDTKKDTWYIYLHEDRLETDSSFIFKKAFRWSNTYRVINEMKGQKLIHYQDYYLDTRLLKKTWTYLNSKEIGITRYYDQNGKLSKEFEH